MQGFSQILPNHLPKRLKTYRNQYEHHLLLKMSGDGITEAQQHLRAFLPLRKVTLLPARLMKVKGFSTPFCGGRCGSALSRGPRRSSGRYFGTGYRPAP